MGRKSPAVGRKVPRSSYERDRRAILKLVPPSSARSSRRKGAEQSTAIAGKRRRGMPGLPVTIVAPLVAAPLVIIREMRQPSYHGIARHQINPKLPRW